MKETLSNRVSVLETKMENLDSKLDELKADIKEMHDCLDKTRDLILREIATLRDAENVTHKEQDTRIGQLENWRWYVVGITTAVVFAAKHLFGI